MSRRKRTLKLYETLYRNPLSLFPSNGPTTAGDIETILFPNGENEIWIKDSKSGRGFRIRASNGPAGFALRVSTFGKAATIADVIPDNESAVGHDAVDFGLCIYNDDEKSQAFRARYVAKQTDAIRRIPLEEFMQTEGKVVQS